MGKSELDGGLNTQIRKVVIRNDKRGIVTQNPDIGADPDVAGSFSLEGRNYRSENEGKTTDDFLWWEMVAF